MLGEEKLNDLGTLLRFGKVYRIPTLQITIDKITEEVRERVLQAERKATKKRILAAKFDDGISVSNIRYVLQM